MTKLISRREALVTVGNSLLLFACGGGGGGGGSATSSDLSAAIASMNTQNEAYPHGVPSSFAWGQRPVVAMGCYPHSDYLPEYWPGDHTRFAGPWTNTTNWFAIYRATDSSGVDLNTSTNTGVLVGTMRLWFLSRRTLTWVPVGEVEPPTWAYSKAENTSGSPLQTSPIKSKTAEGALCLSPPGFFTHGGVLRYDIPLAWNDIAAVLGTVSHKLGRIDPNLPDDADLAKFVVQCGVDYYPNATATLADLGSYAPGAGSGQFIYVRNSWRTSTFFAKATDVSASAILAVGWPTA
jgi:hypothetical protein